MKKSVLHIGTSGGKGGIESFIMNVCSQLDKTKYDFYIVADCDKALIEDEFNSSIGKVIHVSSAVNNKLRYIFDLLRIIDSNKYDVVHIHKNSLSNPVAIYLCKFKKVKKIILHSHNSSPADKHASFRIHNHFKRRVSKLSLKRLACSNVAADWMFTENDQYDIIHNGIDLEKYKFDEMVRKNKRAELKIQRDELAFCSVGRLSAQKNSKFIIDIFEKLHEMNNKSKLYLIGQGNMALEVKAYAQTKKCKDSVFFLGIRNDIPEILQAMDLFLMPSLYEGLPIAAIEAQAASLPLLISETVDGDVKLLESTEVEYLNSSSEIWAKHAIELISQTVRQNVSDQIRCAGYDIKETARIVDRIYEE